MIAPLVLGFVFGFLLQKGGLTRYEKVSAVFRFEDLTVIEFLLAALVTGAVATPVLARAMHTTPSLPDTYVAGNLVGGMLHGVGMALVGFCPGTVVAGAGEGRLDNLLFGIPGLLAGALAFGLAWPAFFPALARIGAVGRVTFGEVLHASPALVALLFVEIGVLVLYLLLRWPRGPARDDRGRAAAPGR